MHCDCYYFFTPPSKQSVRAELVFSHDCCCNSVKCSSVLCATVSPSSRLPPPAAPLSCYASLCLCCGMFGSERLASSPSHWSEADLMAPVFRCSSRSVQSHYDRMKLLIVLFYFRFSCGGGGLLELERDAHRHFFCVISMKTLQPLIKADHTDRHEQM